MCQPINKKVNKQILESSLCFYLGLKTRHEMINYFSTEIPECILVQDKIWELCFVKCFRDENYNCRLVMYSFSDSSQVWSSEPIFRRDSSVKHLGHITSENIFQNKATRQNLIGFRYWKGNGKVFRKLNGLKAPGQSWSQQTGKTRSVLPGDKVVRADTCTEVPTLKQLAETICWMEFVHIETKCMFLSIHRREILDIQFQTIE
jgi:hypothetical protein